MEKQDLFSTIENALIYDVDDDGDTDQIVDTIFDGVVKVLQRDSRFPRLSRAGWDLLFADIAKEACTSLLPYENIDKKWAAEVICDAVVDAIDEARKHHKKPKTAIEGVERLA